MKVNPYKYNLKHTKYELHQTLIILLSKSTK